MKEKKETKDKVLMKRKTVLITIIIFEIIFFFIFALLQKIGEVEITSSDTTGDLIDNDVIDITKNNKTEVVNEDEYYYPVMKSGKYGVIDINGNLVVDTKYESVEMIGNKFLFVNENKVIDLSQNYFADEIIRCPTTHEDYFLEDRFIFYNDKLKGVKNETDKTVISAKFTDIIAVPMYSNMFFLAKEGNMYTLYDYDGNMILDNVSQFSNIYNINKSLSELTEYEIIDRLLLSSISTVTTNNNKGLFFSKTNKFIKLDEYVTIKYVENIDHIYRTDNYLECFDRENKLVKIYDENGNEVPVSNYIYAIIIEEKNGKYALLNRKNDTLLTNYEYDLDNSNTNIEKTNIYIDYEKGIAATVNMQNSIITFFNIDNDGEKIIEYKYDGGNLERDWINKIYCNNKYKVIINKNKLYGIISKDGKEIVPFEYDKIIHFDCFEDIFILRKGDNDILINVENNMKTERYKFETVLELSNVYHPNCFGLEYRKYEDNGIANELINKTYSILNEEKGYFVAKDKKKDKYCILNKKFKEVVSAKYDNIQMLKYMAIFNINGKYGILDIETQKEIVKGLYDNITESSDYRHEMIDGLVIINENGKNGLMDATNGKQLLSCIYDRIEAKYCYASREYRSEFYIEAELKNKITIFIIDSNRNLKELYFGDNIEEIDMQRLDGIGVKKNRKWAYVINNAYVTDFLYDKIIPYFSYEAICFAGVFADNKFGIIDRNGNVILEPFYAKEDIDKLHVEYCVGKWLFYAGDGSIMQPGISTYDDLKYVLDRDRGY